MNKKEILNYARTFRKYSIKSLVGNRYGRLVVVALAARASGNRSLTTLWECRCDCGNTIITQASPMKNGRTKSCGCFGRDQTRARFNIRTLKKQPVRYLKQGARDRNLEVTISDDALIALMEKPCYYCGIEFSNRILDRGYRWNYNGIDRQDNAKGYVEGNCIPCCKNCNRAKDVLSVENFFNLVRRIYEKHSLFQKEKAS